jgi:hopanoid biosynthesis associated protein HpnK
MPVSMVDIRSETEPKGALRGTSARYAVINGDDFGFSAGVNRAIVEAYRRGVLTSTSLMVTGEAFDEAVRLAAETPGLAVGLHLVLVSGSSVLPHREIPHLVDRKGGFHRGPVMTGLVYQFSSAARREIKLEIRAQLERFIQTGLPLSHVDGHLHMHMHPVVFDTLVQVAVEYGVRVIRLPREEVSTAIRIDKSNLMGKLIWGWIFEKLHRHGARKLEQSGIGYADRVYGLMASGHMTEDYMLELIPQMAGRWVELYSHPALAAAGEPVNGPEGPAELAALLSDKVRDALAESGFQLSTFEILGGG